MSNVYAYIFYNENDNLTSMMSSNVDVDVMTQQKVIHKFSHHEIHFFKSKFSLAEETWRVLVDKIII